MKSDWNSIIILPKKTTAFLEITPVETTSSTTKMIPSRMTMFSFLSKFFASIINLLTQIKSLKSIEYTQSSILEFLSEICNMYYVSPIIYMYVSQLCNCSLKFGVVFSHCRPKQCKSYRTKHHRLVEISNLLLSELIG